MDSYKSSFDIMNCAGWAYQTIWQKRSILAQMAIFPFVVKTLLALLTIVYFEDADMLRKTMIRLPDFFIEGWYLIGAVSLLAFNDPSFASPFGKASELAQQKRQRTILSAILIYVLIQLGFAAYNYGVFSFLPDVPGEAQQESDPLKVFGLFLAIILVIRFFNLLWLYIPMSVDGTLRRYMQESIRFRFSARLFLVWLVSILPFTLIFFGVFGLLLDSSQSNEQANVQGTPFAFKAFLVLLQSAYELLIGLVQIIAVYYALFYEKTLQDLGRQ